MGTIALRWVQERNKVPTAAEVRAYASHHQIQMMRAKVALLDASPVRLQYWDADVPEGKWVDVPTVIVERA